MTRDEAFALVRNCFDDSKEDPDPEAWFHPHNGETYVDLLETLLDTWHLDEVAATNILAAAYGAAADEYGA